MKLDPQSALNRTQTLMLDMDGTLLDLAFDNYMWKEMVPRRYAVANDMPLQDAKDLLMAKYAAVAGDLDWYCLDHWCERLDIDVVQLHHDASHRIAWLPGALAFLQEVHRRDVRVLLVTNAHPETLALKDAMTGLADYLDEMHSSHDYGHAKESQDFWHALREEVGFDPASTLFVDDSQPVLQSANKYGIEMLVTIEQPDTSQPLQDGSEFAAVKGVGDLL